MAFLCTDDSASATATTVDTEGKLLKMRVTWLSKMLNYVFIVFDAIQAIGKPICPGYKFAPFF